MQAFELADLAINTQLRLDASWLLFLTINSTIIGAIILIERTFSVLEKSVATAIYIGGIALSVTAIIFDEKLTRTKLEANTSAGD